MIISKKENIYLQIDRYFEKKKTLLEYKVEILFKVWNFNTVRSYVY